MHCLPVVSDNLKSDKILPRLQQDGFFRVDVEILRGVRDGDIEVNGLVEHIDKRFLLPLDAIDVDGRYTAGYMVTVYGEPDVSHKERFPGIGDRSQFPPLRMPAVQGRTDDPHIFQHVRPGTQEIFLSCISANENGRRQLLPVKDDDYIIFRPRDGEGCRLIGDLEEFQCVARNLYLEQAFGGRYRSYLVFGHAELDIPDGIAFFINDPSFDGDALLCRRKGGEQQKSGNQLDSHNYKFSFLSDDDTQVPSGLTLQAIQKEVLTRGS